jgi:hypothetical protein
MNLILAMLWLVCVVGVFIYEYQTGDRILIRGTDLSFGWLLLVLSMYNFARWFSLRSARARQKAIEEVQAQRQLSGRVRRLRPEEPPDPNLDFTDKPPANRRIQDRPPSNN